MTLRSGHAQKPKSTIGIERLSIGGIMFGCRNASSYPTAWRRNSTSIIVVRERLEFPVMERLASVARRKTQL